MAEFKFQDPGEGIHEGEIVEIHVSAGDAVTEGDVLITVETDKAAVEIPSPFDGEVDGIEVAEDDVVEVGDVILTYTPAGEEAEGEEEAAAEVEPAEADEAEEAEEGEEEAEPAGAEEAEEAEEEGEGESAGEKEAETGAAAGGGVAGAVEEEDEEDETEEKAASEEPEGPIPASPATRRRARELEVDLAEVYPGSGPEGRVTTEDVEAAAEGEEPEAREEAEERPPEEAEAEEPPPEEREEAPAEAAEEEAPEAEAEPEEGAGEPEAEAPAAEELDRWGPVTREKLRRVRRTTAIRMQEAWRTIPHVTHHDVADITRLERFRERHREAVDEAGGELTLTALAVKAVVAALRDFPRFNASVDMEAEEIVLREYVNVGVAVDTDRGLIVPVVRDVDAKSITEVAVELSGLVERTRSGEITRDELQGGTFTITNPGPLGGTSFTPIINPPQVAILGLAAARREPVVVDESDTVAVRLRLPLSLAFDHRVNDGADAARFCTRLVEILEDPEELVLNL